MNWLPARQGLGVVSGGGCRGRGLRSAALVTVYFSGALALAACDLGGGPQTGPGLEPPGGDRADVAGRPTTMNMNPGSTGNFGNQPAQTPGGTNPQPMTTGSGGTAANPPSSMSGGSAGMSGAPNGADHGSTGTGGTSGGTMSDPSTGCTTVSAGLGLHLLVDASFGMVVPRDLWQPLGEALDAWSASDAMATTQIGAQLFAGECSADAYATATVPIADASQLAAALDAQMSTSMHGFAQLPRSRSCRQRPGPAMGRDHARQRRGVVDQRQHADRMRRHGCCRGGRNGGERRARAAASGTHVRARDASGGRPRRDRGRRRDLRGSHRR